jgi:hypothetical protein
MTVRKTPANVHIPEVETDYIEVTDIVAYCTEVSRFSHSWLSLSLCRSDSDKELIASKFLVNGKFYLTVVGRRQGLL